jgi:hypothetical protein
LRDPNSKITNPKKGLVECSSGKAPAYKHKAPNTNKQTNKKPKTQKKHYILYNPYFSKIKYVNMQKPYALLVWLKWFFWPGTGGSCL